MAEELDDLEKKLKELKELYSPASADKEKEEPPDPTTSDGSETIPQAIKRLKKLYSTNPSDEIRREYESEIARLREEIERLKQIDIKRDLEGAISTKERFRSDVPEFNPDRFGDELDFNPDRVREDKSKLEEALSDRKWVRNYDAIKSASKYILGIGALAAIGIGAYYLREDLSSLISTIKPYIINTLKGVGAGVFGGCGIMTGVTIVEAREGNKIEFMDYIRLMIISAVGGAVGGGLAYNVIPPEVIPSPLIPEEKFNPFTIPNFIIRSIIPGGVGAMGLCALISSFKTKD